MKLKILLAALVTLFTLHSEAASRSNGLFYYTHLLPSPYTLPAGRLTYGTSVAIGVTDFFQIGTDIVRDLFGFYNAKAKLALIDTSAFAFALTFGFQSYEIDLDAGGSLSVTSLQPGGVIAIAIHPQLAWYLGGHYDISNQTLSTAGIETSGFVSGTSYSSDLAWAYDPPRRKRRVSRADREPAQERRRRRRTKTRYLGNPGNVLAVGGSYDTTYDIYGVGLSHAWPGFKLGVHYYPNAEKNKFLPIIVGGGSVQL